MAGASWRSEADSRAERRNCRSLAGKFCSRELPARSTAWNADELRLPARLLGLRRTSPRRLTRSAPRGVCTAEASTGLAEITFTSCRTVIDVRRRRAIRKNIIGHDAA